MRKIYTPDFIQKDSNPNQSKGKLFSFALLCSLLLSFAAFSQTAIINPATDGAFEGASFAADGWTALNNASGAASWVQSTGATAGFTGSKCAYITNNEGGTPPPHAYTSGTAARVSALYKDVTVPIDEPIIKLTFKWVCLGEAADVLQVWAVPTSYTPPNVAVGITTDASPIPTGRKQLGFFRNSGSWTNAEITIPSDYVGTTFRLVFQWRNDFSVTYNPPIAIDDVSLTSYCIGAVTGEATNITATSATANWYALDDATSYDLRHRSYVAGAYTSWTTISNLTGTSTSLTGLNPSFYYEYEVKANGPVCQTYSGTIGFIALCNAEVAPTAVQNFSNFSTTAPNPPCWSEAKGAVAASSVLTGTLSNWSGIKFANTGTNIGAKISLNSISTGEWLFSQPIDLGMTAGLYRVKYNMAVTSVGGTVVQATLGTHNVRVLISTDGGATWSNTNIIKTYTGAGTYSNTGQIETIDLTTYSGVVRIAFVASTTVATPAVDFFIDNFIVEAIPSVPPSCATGHIPADLATEFARNGTLSWTAASGSPTSYDVYFGTNSNPPFVGNQTGLTYTPSVLSASTLYYWKVEPKNGNGTASCSVKSFTTGNAFNYCTVSTTDAGSYTSAFNTTLATNNVSYVATLQPTESYSNQTAQNFQVQQGTLFNFSHTYSASGGNAVSIWIDYNENGVFDVAERVYYVGDANLTKTGSITVPFSTPLGVYRMRVRSQLASGSNPTACGNLSSGSTVDYALNVIAAPSCFAPTGLTSNAITTNSATLNWTASFEAPSNGYDYYYTTANVAPDALTTPNGTVGAGITSVNIASLSTNTVYYFWIRGNCGGGDTSAWSSSATFKTACVAVASFSENFDSMNLGTMLPDCWTRVVIGAASLEIVDYTPASGNRNLLMSGTGTTKSMAVLPEFSNVNAGTHWLKFKVKSATAGGVLKFGYVNGAGAVTIANFVELQTIAVPNTTNVNSEQAFQVPTSVPSTARLAILHNGVNTYSNFIDDVSWEAIPGCSIPTDGAVEILTTSTAKLTWTASVSNPSEGYVWEVRSSGAAGSGATGLASSGSVAAGILTANATGLVIDTNYSFYVRSKCQYSNFSTWSGPVAFTITCPTGVWVGTTSDWNTASNWSDNRVPGPCTTVTVNVSNPMTISGDVKISTIALGATAVVTVNSSLEVGNTSVTTGGVLTIASNAALLQSVGAVNSGVATVKRNSESLFRQDYTLWSSPVFEPNLRNFSPNTIFSRFYTYDFSNPVTGVNGDYKQEINNAAEVTSKKFELAKGYLIRMPNITSPVIVGYEDYSTELVFNGEFKGNLNNGEVQIPLYGVVASVSNGLNLVGNPYPSPIKISTFLTQNNTKITGTMYFWRKKNSFSSPVGSGYATLNGSGLVGGSLNGQSLTHIKTGQGFFVQSIGATPGNLVFNNTMREKETTAGIFFKSANDNPQSTEMHRFWLDLSNANGIVGQTLVAYATGATQDVDSNFDALYFNDSPLALTSIINNNEYIIQGRAVPFMDSDVVPLGFKTDVAGSFTIALTDSEGVFAENQDILLLDKSNNTLHNLKTAAYTFTTPVGIFNDRFEVQYNGTLGTNNPNLASNTILIAVKDQKIKINSGSVTMQKIELFDIQGRLVYSLDGINSSTKEIEHLNSANQVLIVKIKTAENDVITRKIMF